MKLLCFLLCVAGVASSCDPTQSGCLDVLEHDVNVEPALEMLQMKSTKIVEEDQDAEEADLEDDEEMDLEDDDEADVEDDDEAAAEVTANSTDDEDESDVEWGSLDESMTWPTGPKESSDAWCKSGKKCSSPRGWINAQLSLAKCSDKCTNSRTCKKFWYNADSMHCGICSKCDAGVPSQKNQEGYNIYKKWVLKFPFKGLCKEKHNSEKSLKKARGCKKRAKKLGAVAFAYKKKKCRTWKKCSQNKKGGWYVNKAR